jgi:Tfp pilus assembly protein PilV
MRDVGTKNKLPDSGFTLTEALLSSVVIAVCVMAVSAAFYGGMQNLRDEGRLFEAMNYAEGKMDELIATDFDNLSGGTDFVVVQGRELQRHWQVTPYDMDGDTAVDQDAILLVVTVQDVELATLLVDSAGRVTCKR